MALPLSKLTIIVGAGILGSILAKEAHGTNLTDFFSGAFKMVFRQLKQEESTTPSTKPRNDLLLQQVKSLRQELQLLASNRSVTIVASGGSGSGSRRYGVIIVVVVVGYGYIRWKGWKLPDLMFATKRSLSDACASVSKQLESVYSSISATKRHLSQRIDRVDSKIDDCADNMAAVREDVVEIRGEVRLIGGNVESVHEVVRTLETKINRIEGKQSETIFGLSKLIAFVRNIENGKPLEQIEADPSNSARPVLESSQPALPARAASLPSNSSPIISSPSSNGSQKRSLQTPASGSGIKDIFGFSDATEGSSHSSADSCNVVPGRKPSSIYTLTRSHSTAIRSFK